MPPAPPAPPLSSRAKTGPFVSLFPSSRGFRHSPEVTLKDGKKKRGAKPRLVEHVSAIDDESKKRRKLQEEVENGRRARAGLDKALRLQYRQVRTVFPSKMATSDDVCCRFEGIKQEEESPLSLSRLTLSCDEPM